MSSEEQQRREGEVPPEESFREEPADERVSEPVEVGGSEGPGAIPPDEVAGEELGDGGAVQKEPPSEEELEITQDEVSTLTEELELTRGELTAALRERDGYLDDMRRLKAEMENSRKRQERERARIVELASEKLVKELLPVLDNLERALEAEGDIRDGVRATYEQLLAVLAREGLAPVASDVGEGFDPAVHEAVMGQPSEEQEEDTILQTLERGYALNGRPIRPAKVIVAK